MKLIAFANDNAYFSSHRIALLRALGLEVAFCQNAKEVIDQFELPADKRPKMLITDGVLGYGGVFSEDETNGGLETGVALYRSLRKSNPDLPVIIYTTEGRTFLDLAPAKDQLLAVISSYDENATALILMAAARMFPE